MHPRNVYAQEYVTRNNDGEAPTNWNDEHARCLYTQKLLFRDFGVTCKVTVDRLCPALPSRLNYLHWIEDILEAACPRASTDNIATTTSLPVCGLDIGTGYLAIYAILACVMHRDWRMIGTDIDASALGHAQHVLDDPANEALDLSRRVRLLHTRQDTLIPASDTNDVSFIMCNPPFYASKQERDALRQAKVEYYHPCSAHDTELYTAGGELEFVQRLIHESTLDQHRERIPWYTSMLGRHSSVLAVVQTLKQYQITNYALTELIQGRTRRWAIAWSFLAHRLPDNIARNVGPSLTACKPPSCTRTWNMRYSNEDELYNQLCHLDTLPNDAVEWHTNPLALVVWAPCWTRSARRARSRGESYTRRASTPLVCVRWDVVNNTCVHVHWTFGEDRTVFDSLCAHLQGQLRVQKASQRLSNATVRLEC